MLDFHDITFLKQKFGKIISKAYHEANLDFDNISYGMVYTHYFECFEKNEIKNFISSEPEQIIEDIFGDFNFDGFIEETGPLYWAGTQYMTIFLNTLLPINTIFLLCPLSEMVEKYNCYHEIREKELVTDFISNNLKRSILRSLRGNKYSIRELSLLTGIPTGTLKTYENDNNVLFKASSENINKLAFVLKTPVSLFCRNTFFTTLSKNIISSDPEFEAFFINLIKKYYKVQEDTTLDLLVHNDSQYPYSVNIDEPTILLLENNKRIIISDDKLLNFIRLSNQALISYNTAEDELLF